MTSSKDESLEQRKRRLLQETKALENEAGQAIEQEKLQSLIDGFLESENTGASVDRYELLATHPEQAEELLAFFAKYDQDKARGESNAIVSLTGASPPDNANQHARKLQTPPVTGVSYSRVPRSRSLASNGLGGIAFSFIAAFIGASIGFSIADVDNHEMSEYFLHIPLLFNKVIGGLLGAVLGAVIGFPIGVLVNKLLNTR